MQRSDLSADAKAKVEALLTSSDNLWGVACQLAQDYKDDGHVEKAEFAAHEFYYSILQAGLACCIAMSDGGAIPANDAHNQCHNLIRDLYAKVQGEQCSYPAKFEKLSHLRNVSDYADEHIDASQLSSRDVSIWNSIRELCKEKTNRILGKPIIRCN